MQKRQYTAPSLTAVNFRNERGYTLSLELETAVNPLDGYIEMMMLDEHNNNDYRETETFVDHSDWTDDNSGSFWL